MADHEGPLPGATNTIRVRDDVLSIGNSTFYSTDILREDISLLDLLGDRELMERAFRIQNPVIRRRQATIHLTSGWDVSIIWGSGALCVNHDRGLMSVDPFIEEPTNAEVAVIHRQHGHWLDLSDLDNFQVLGEPNDTSVRGWANTTEINHIISRVLFIHQEPVPDAIDVIFQDEAIDRNDYYAEPAHLEPEEDIADDDF